MTISYKKTHILSLNWLSISVIIFLLGWCNWYISIPITLSIFYLQWKFYKNLSITEELSISKKQILIASIIIIIMTALMGVGGYVVQPNDHYYRNSWFIDIINYNWPIYNSDENLYMCYYFTFWLVPALIGKIFNSIDIGFFTQLIWLSIGFFLLFLEICIYIGKTKIGTLFIFYLFAGWKIFECLLYYPFIGGNTISNTILTLSTNGSPGVFHAGPMIQLLHDPFNQTIPLFLTMMLILNNRKTLYLGFIYSFVLYYAPFPFIGLAPIVIYLFLRNTDFSTIKTCCKSCFTLPNIIAILLILIIGFFYLANINASHKGLRPTENIFADIYSFILYLIFEFVIFLIIGYKNCEDKKIICISFVSVCIFGWFQIGEHNDFCFRTNMPLIFLLCLLVIKTFYQNRTTNKIKKLIICCLLIGGIPAQIHSCLRYISTYYIYSGKNQTELNNYQSFYDVKNMYIMQQMKTRNDEFGSIFGKGEEYDWTVNSLKASPDSFFFKYLSRK